MQDSKIKDPTIKLFRKKISIPAYGETPAISGEDLPSWEREIEKKNKEEEEEIEAEKAEKGLAAVKTTHTLPPDEEKPGRAALKTTDTLPPDEEKPLDPKSLPETNVYSKNTSINKESAKTKASKTQKVQNDATNSQEKTIEKPDRTLPCPRCKSMNTKFCYYNNYNINQPRHFCKACQRYWTAGGAIRNVPVGAGRRKSKNCASRYPHITISEALQAARIGGPSGTFHPAMKTNGRVHSFGLDTPICDSTASALNIADKKDLNDTQNFFHGLEEPRIAVSCTGGGKNSDECSSKSSVTGSNSLAEGGKASPKEPFVQNSNGLTPPISCLPGVPWHCPWNSAFPPPAFCPPRFPMSFYPSYWNYSIPGTLSTGMQSPQSSSSSNQNAPCSNPNSYRLGKHSRDGDMPKPEDSEKEEPSMHKVGCALVRKILRIDDPSEVAKSSIWTTLEINNESFAGGGLFKAFQTIGAAKNHIAEGSLLLRANPATLSQSINFHERT